MDVFFFLLLVIYFSFEKKVNQEAVEIVKKYREGRKQHALSDEDIQLRMVIILSDLSPFGGVCFISKLKIETINFFYYYLNKNA